MTNTSRPLTPQPLERPSPLALVRHLPSYDRHPVVADTNVLFQDSLRYLQQPFTVLTFLAREEVITLLTCEHVRARMPELIAHKSKRPIEHLRIWEQAYLPIVPFVAIPERCAPATPRSRRPASSGRRD